MRLGLIDAGFEMCRLTRKSSAKVVPVIRNSHGYAFTIICNGRLVDLRSRQTRYIRPQQPGCNNAPNGGLTTMRALTAKCGLRSVLKKAPKIDADTKGSHQPIRAGMIIFTEGGLS
jgi:hypothetical protein